MRMHLDLKKEHRKELWAAIAGIVILLITVLLSVTHHYFF